VVEKITPKNTIFYVCGWQGTVDGVLNFVRPLGFLLEKEKDKAKDGNFSVKFESYG
jgi:ferredoxin--NADP+ reductase